MPLSKDQIKRRGLVLFAHADRYRAAGYDLSIESILIAPPPGRRSSTDDVREYREPYKVPSAGMVKVISSEVVHLPIDVAGYALVKNSMSNQGVLAINIGIIDPGYSGPVSSTLINFGPDPLILKPGDPFLRLSFHTVGEPCEEHAADCYTKVQYSNNAKLDVFRSGSDKFLNLSQLSDELLEKGLSQAKKWSLAGLGGLATVLAIVALVVPIYAALWVLTVEAVRRWLVPVIEGI